MRREKQNGYRGVARAADWLNMFFFTVQNNQFFNIAGYLCSIRALFVLYFVQLDNNYDYSLLRSKTMNFYWQPCTSFTWNVSSIESRCSGNEPTPLLKSRPGEEGRQL